MLNITICDDERAEITYLTGLVRKWASLREADALIHEYESAESFLFAYEDDKSADILLLDIQMKEMDGVGLARKLRRDDETAQIVFVTGYPDFIAEGYDVSALHYLLKPVGEEKLFEVLDKAAAKANEAEPVLIAESEGSLLRVMQKDILYVEALWPAVKIATADGAFEIKANFSDIEGRLEQKSFVRCHRSYIAGLRHVKRLTKTDLVLDGDILVPLSRRLYHAAHQAFVNYHKERGGWA